jgi:hypothetical protein
MSHPITSSESFTSVSPDLRRPRISRTGAEGRDVPSFRALLERQNAYRAAEGDGR